MFAFMVKLFWWEYELEGHSGPESLTCTMCTSLVQWKVMIKTIWFRPSGFRKEDFPILTLYKTCDPHGGTIFDPRDII